MNKKREKPCYGPLPLLLLPFAGGFSLLELLQHLLSFDGGTIGKVRQNPSLVRLPP